MERNKNLIGLSGPRGVGKDTVASFLINNYGYKKESLAAPLKDMTAAIFRWDREMLEGITPEHRQARKVPDEWWERKLDWKNHKGYIKSKRFTPEFALQYLGTDIMRECFDPALWCHSLDRRLDPDRKIILTDIRFRDEFNVIKSKNGFCFELMRGQLPDFYYAALQMNNSEFMFKDRYISELEKDFNTHRSEFMWIGLPFDAAIDNNKSVEKSANRILNFIGESI